MSIDEQIVIKMWTSHEQLGKKFVTSHGWVIKKESIIYEQVVNESLEWKSNNKEVMNK